MDKWFLYSLSLKNLVNHKLRTYLTFAAIAVGIGAIVFLVSFAYGLQAMVTETVTGGDAFKLIDVGTENSQIIKLDDEALNKIRAISSVVEVQTIINAGGKEVANGKEVDSAFYGTSAKYMQWAGIKTRWGSTFNDGSTRQAIVNTSFLESLSINPDQAVGRELDFDVVIPKEIAKEDKYLTQKNQIFTIEGVIRDKNAAQVYIKQSDLMALGADKFSQAKVQVADQNKVAEVRKQIENLGLKTQYVGDTVAQIDQLFKIFKIVLASFGLIALIVATLGMFNTLTISLLERTKEVALMKILGMQRRDIRALFLTESIIISTSGGVLGIILGVILSKVANAVLNQIAVGSGGDAVTIFIFPFWFIVVVVLFSFAIGFLTGLYPARRAERVDALDVLRYE